MDNFDSDNEQKMLVTVVYDRPEAALRVLGMISRIKDQLDSGLEFDIRLWRVDILALPEAVSEARCDTRLSRILAIATIDGKSEGLKDTMDLVSEWTDNEEAQQKRRLLLVLNADGEEIMVEMPSVV